MWYQNIGSMFFCFIIKHVCDGRSDRQTDVRQNYDPQDHVSIAASRGKKISCRCVCLFDDTKPWYPLQGDKVAKNILKLTQKRRHFCMRKNKLRMSLIVTFITTQAVQQCVKQKRLISNYKVFNCKVYNHKTLLVRITLQLAL